MLDDGAGVDVVLQFGWNEQMTSGPNDEPEQLRQIQDGLLEGEQIQAVYDCTGAGTGFVGVTDRRLILQDKARHIRNLIL